MEGWAHLGLSPIWPLWAGTKESWTPCMAAQASKNTFYVLLFMTQPQKSHSVTLPHSIGQNSHKHDEIQGAGTKIPPLYVRYAQNIQEASSAIPESCFLRILVSLVFSVPRESRTTHPLSHLRGRLMGVCSHPTQPLTVTAGMCHQ